MVMQPGDLIRTPQWAWHEHENQGSEAMIWADGLDVPLIETLQVVSVERRHEERLRVKEGTIHPSLYGMMRPAGHAAQQMAAPLHYRWSDTYAALQRLAEKSIRVTRFGCTKLIISCTGKRISRIVQTFTSKSGVLQ